MESARRQPHSGFTLAVRLYLLLAAIFLPTFGVYYVYTMRHVEVLHAREVEGIVKLGSSQIEKWLGDSSLRDMSEAERVELEGELKRIISEPNGIDSVAVFFGDGKGGLTYLAGQGPFATEKASTQDIEAMQKDQSSKMEVQRRESRSISVSAPLRHRTQVIGAIHLEVSPEKVGRRIPDLRMSLVIGAVGMMLILGVGLAFFFQFAVRRPVHGLIEAMTKASEGDLTALVDVRSGELGWLAGSYNQMMRRLKSSVDENKVLIAQINAFNSELQEKIRGATQELGAKNAQLQAANEKLFLIQRQMTTLEKLATLGQLATTIAHELGTPLNAISGHLQLLLQDSVSDAKVLDRLHVIDAQVDRLTGIVRDVLKTMRVPPPRTSLVSVTRVIEEVVNLITPVVEKRRISLETRLNMEVPLVNADAHQLEQVLMNLFTNAMDAMHEGGALTVTTGHVLAPEAEHLLQESSLSPNGTSYARIDVRDTGIGMDEETARSAFEPFFTTKGVDGPPSSTASMGLGLGLSICRQIVKNHHGEILVRSEKGRGTTFTILLPVEGGRVS